MNTPREEEPLAPEAQKLVDELFATSSRSRTRAARNDRFEKFDSLGVRAMARMVELGLGLLGLVAGIWAAISDADWAVQVAIGCAFVTWVLFYAAKEFSGSTADSVTRVVGASLSAVGLAIALGARNPVWFLLIVVLLPIWFMRN